MVITTSLVQRTILVLVLCGGLQVYAHDMTQPDDIDLAARAKVIKKLADEQTGGDELGLMDALMNMQNWQEQSIRAQQEQYARSLLLIPEVLATRLKTVSQPFNQLYHRALLATFIDERIQDAIPMLEQGAACVAHQERIERILGGFTLLRHFEADAQGGSLWSLYLRTPKGADAQVETISKTLSDLSHDLRVLVASTQAIEQESATRLQELADLCRALAQRDIRAVLYAVAHAMAVPARHVLTDLVAVEKELTSLLPEQPVELMRLDFAQLEQHKALEVLIASCRAQQRTLQLFIDIEKTLLSPLQWQGYTVCDMAARVLFALMGMQHKFVSQGDNNLLFVPWIEWWFVRPFYAVYYTYTFLATRSDANMALDPRMPSLAPSVLAQGLSQLQSNTALDLLCRGMQVSEQELEQMLPAVVAAALRIDGYKYPPAVFGVVAFGALCDIGWPLLRDMMPDWLSNVGLAFSRMSDTQLGGLLGQALFKGAGYSVQRRMMTIMSSCALQAFYLHLKNPHLTAHLRDVLLSEKSFFDGHSLATIVPGTGSAASAPAKKLWNQTSIMGMYFGQSVVSSKLAALCASVLSPEQWRSIVKASGGVINKKVLSTVMHLGMTKVLCTGLEHPHIGKSWQDITGISGHYLPDCNQVDPLQRGSMTYLNHAKPILYPHFDSFGTYAAYTALDHLFAIVGYKTGGALLGSPVNYIGKQVWSLLNAEQEGHPSAGANKDAADLLLAQFCRGKTEEEIVALLKNPFLKNMFSTYDGLVEAESLYGQLKVAFIGMADMLAGMGDVIQRGQYNLDNQATQAASMTIAEIIMTLGDVGLLDEAQAYDYALDYLSKRQKGDEQGARKLLGTVFDTAAGQWHKALGGYLGQWAAQGGLYYAWNRGLSTTVKDWVA